MNLRNLPWRPVLAGAVVLLMVGSIARTVFAAPPTEPNAEDVDAAKREVVPDAGLDERFARPDDYDVAGNGIVEPRQRETRISAAVAGRVGSVVVQEGQDVAADAVLVELDAGVERAQLAAAEADVQAAQADSDKTRRGVRTEDLDAAKAVAAAAAARAALSAGVLARTEPLAASGHVTDDELDRARRQAQVDAASAAQADAQLRAAVAGSRREDVLAADARLAAAVARRDEAAARLDQRVVRSPLGGQVLQVLVRPGEYQQPGGDPLVVVGDVSELRVRMDVDERDIGRVKPGDTAIVRTIAWPGRDFGAHVVEIGQRMGRKNVRTDDPVERNDTKILEVVLVLDAGHELVVGQRVVAYVQTGGGQG